MQLKELASVRHSGGYFYYWLLFPGEVGATRHLIFFFLYFIYLFESEAQAGGRSRGRGSSRLPTEQGAQRGAPSRDPEITT